MLFQNKNIKLSLEQEMLASGLIVVLLAVIIKIVTKIKHKSKGTTQPTNPVTEENEQKKALMDIEMKRDEHKYQLHIAKLNHSFASLERKDKLKEKEMDYAQVSQMDNQKKIFEIISGLTSKVEVADLKEVAYTATILHSIQAGKSVDPEVLDVVASKIANPVLTDELDEVAKICELKQSQSTEVLTYDEMPTEIM